MIPKKIHFCWYGKKNYPELIQNCLSSWRKFMPDYELVLWNEENTDFSNFWLKNALSQKKFAFIADFIRFKALHDHGGIYLDTDMLLVKPLDPFLDHDFFMGFEDKVHVNMAIVGAQRNHPLLKLILDEYESLFDTGNYRVITSVVTPLIENYMGSLDPNQVKVKNGVALYPADYFYPVPYTSEEKLENFEPFVTSNTVAIHLWNKSWYDEFSYFSLQEYQKGFRLLFSKLSKNPFQPISYYRFLIYSLFINFKKSLFGKTKSNDHPPIQ